MTTRKSKVASAILIATIAGGFIAAETLPVHAAENCLPGPKGAAPKGSHWFYRIDHATKKNCWYVRAEGGASRAANSARAQALPRAENSLQPSVANARAEATPADIGQSSNGAAESSPFPAPATVQAPDDSQGALASRWPDQMTADRTAIPTPQQPAAANVASALPVVSPSAPATPAAPLPIKTASASRSLPFLLVEIAGVLAIGAIFGSILLNMGRARRNEQDFHRTQHAPWDAADVGATIDSPPLATNASTRQTRFAREDHKPIIPDEIVQLLAKLSKEAPA